MMRLQEPERGACTPSRARQYLAHRPHCRRQPNNIATVFTRWHRPAAQDYFRDVTRDDVRELLPAHADALADPAFLIPPLGRSLALLGDDAAAGATCMTQKRLIAMRRGTLQSAAAAAEAVRTCYCPDSYCPAQANC